MHGARVIDAWHCLWLLPRLVADKSRGIGLELLQAVLTAEVVVAAAMSIRGGRGRGINRHPTNRIYLHIAFRLVLCRRLANLNQIHAAIIGMEAMRRASFLRGGKERRQLDLPA